ncbi:MAG: non-canonical purine NTP pyrophosphatase [Acidobacteriota bacterium]
MSRSPLAGVTLVTGNRHKLEEARRLLGAAGEDLDSAAVDLPEIQSLDLQEVLSAKAEEAYRRLGRPVVVEDTGLGLHAFGGFPGPFIKWMLEAAGLETLARSAHALGDPRATVRCGLHYRDHQGSVVAIAEVTGSLTATPQGDGGFGWDPIFQPRGEGRTYAEMDTGSKDALGHRGKAWRQLLDRLEVERRA